MHLPLNAFERTPAASVSGALRSLIFVVEDDADIARLITHNLRASGFEVRSFVSGASVVSEALREMPALFLLDVMLPGSDGFELCRHIRQTPAISATPVIFLTAKTSEADRVKGLELGGDDYMTKPFSPAEFVARVKALIRRSLLSDERDGAEEIIASGELEINYQRHEARVSGAVIELAPKEFEILYLMVKKSGRVMTRQFLMERIWGRPYENTSRVIDTHIKNIRKALGAMQDSLLTVEGLGYKWAQPD